MSFSVILYVKTKKCKICEQEKLTDEFQILIRKSRDNSKSWQCFNSYCKKCANQRKSILYHQNIEKEQALNKKRYYENHQKNLDRQKVKYQKNKQKYLARQKQYKQEKRQSDPFFVFIENLRKHCCRAFKNLSKTNKTKTLLGCSFEQAKKHIESLWQEGMSWDNYGLFGWHIDHITPLSSAATEEDAEKLCHYTNLQPLWAKDNLSKGKKIVDINQN